MKKRLFLIITAVLVFAGIGTGIFFFVKNYKYEHEVVPYEEAANTMPEDGVLVLRPAEDGTTKLSWTEAPGAEGYLVEILDAAAEEEWEKSRAKQEESREGSEPVETVQAPEPLFSREVTAGTSCELPAFSGEKLVTLRVRSYVRYTVYKEEFTRYGDRALEKTDYFKSPSVTDAASVADIENRKVSVTYQINDGTECVISILSEESAGKVRCLKETSTEFCFGEGEEFEMLSPGEEFRLTFTANRIEEGLEIYGLPTAETVIVRDDLLGREPNLLCEDEGYNVYTFSWDETAGVGYEVQRYDEDEELWERVEAVSWDGERTYTTPHLPKFNSYTYRVVSIGDEAADCSEYAAVSEEIRVTTKESPVFCTIWPTKELETFRDSELTEGTGGHVTAGKAYCVLEEKGGAFLVREGDEELYIDSNYCFIDVQEYLGELCRYNITNSYSSKYLVHEFEIPKVSGRTVTGYEKVAQDDGTFLVPLLYPTAKKLAVAAKEAVSQGCRLKIYDSFRPNKATVYLYDACEKILDEKLPDETYSGVSISSLKLPEPDPVSAETAGAEEAGEAEPQQEAYLTYRKIMLTEKFDLHYFIAKGVSKHNYGMALDLTIVDADSGKELKMQTSMHDLSAYSVRENNNSNANKLSDIMTAAGFKTLISEWWHFNDMETFESLDLVAVVEGVSARGWIANDNGWRYRDSGGNILKNCTETIDGKEYVFDESGYVTDY